MTHLSRLALATTLGLAVCGVARAQQQCHRHLVPSQATSYTTTWTFPKFDPSGGDVLTSVAVTMSGRADGGLYMENHGTSSVTVASHFSATFNLRRPDNSVLLTGSVDRAFSDLLQAYDGNQNYAGPSGEKHENLAPSFNVNHTSPPPASDLALFTGAGNITLTIEAIDTSSFTPSANLQTDVKQDADVKLQVCYTYDKDCNHNGIPDSTDISNGMADLNADGIPDQCQPMTKGYCEGGGSSTGSANCPCGNNGPNGTQGGCLNQNGVGGLLVASGTPSIANDTLLLTASNVPSGAGYFFQGTQSTASGAGTPFGNGLRCVSGNVIRIKKIPTAAGGGVFPAPGQPPIHVLLNLNAGDTRFYQVWYRDAMGPCGQPFNTTNAVFVVWGL